MTPVASERQLLFGILAVQFNFVPLETLVDALHDWRQTKSKSLATVFVERGDLAPRALAQLEGVVEQFLDNHQNDPQRALAALTAVHSVRQTLSQVIDADGPANRGHLSPAPTVPPTIAEMASPTHGGTDLHAMPSARFRILRFHAKGNLGRVSVAYDSELGREVALKEIQDAHADSRASQSRFLLEAEITGGLEHPGIVPVYSLGRHPDGRPFYAMRLIRGQSLHDAIAAFHGKGAARSLGRPRAVRYDSRAFRQLLGRFVDVCDAIEYAHQRGVLHRDLKPGNIMLGRFGETLVVDWGLAKPLGARISRSHEPEEIDDLPPLAPLSGSQTEETLAGTVLGTPHYMSPEQASGRVDLLGPMTDVYSLGATLFHLLTGELPVAGDRFDDVLTRVRSGELRRPRETRPEVPRPLDAICRKAMAVDPADRYRSVRELAADIERYLADEPVVAWDEPLEVRARRWIRRHPGRVAAGAAAIFVGLTAVVLLSLVLQLKNTQLSGLADDLRLARDRAVSNEEDAIKRLEQLERGNQVLLAIFKDFDIRQVKLSRDPIEAVLATRLIKAGSELDGEAVGDPLVTASLQNRLGTTLISLGHASAAIGILERASATRTQRLGRDHGDTLETTNHLAEAYREARQPEKAIALHEETWQRRRAQLGDSHIETLTSMNNLALAYQEGGQLAKAFPLHESVLNQRRATLGADHTDTLISMNNLALAYQEAGQVAKALPLHEEVYRSFKTKLGPDHARTLASMLNLSEAYQEARQLDKAIPLNEEALRLTRSTLGADHPHTMITMNNLAVAYLVAQEPTKALPLFEQTLQLKRTRLGPKDPSTLASLLNYGATFLAAGKIDEGSKVLSEYLDIQRQQLGGTTAPFATLLARVAVGYLRANCPSQAEPLLRECLQIRQKHEPDAWTTFSTHLMLGGALLDQRMYAEAEPHLRMGYEGLKARTAALPEAAKGQLPSALDKLIRLHKALGQPELATKWEEERAHFAEAAKKP